jgi:hypothetical protein
MQLLNISHENEVVVLNKPEEFNDSFKQAHVVASLVNTSGVACAVLFVKFKQDFIHQMMTLFPRLLDTSTLWIIFPTATTKKELADTTLSFDWDFLGDYRLQPIKQVTINENWKAIKLKKAKFD